MPLLLLLFLSLGLSASPRSAAGASVLYVKPTHGATCPGEPCHTLDEYASNAIHPNNTIMEFLPGTHNLNDTFLMKNFINVAFSGNRSETHISCDSESAAFRFERGADVTINGLSFVGCGKDYPHGPLLFFEVQNVNIFQIRINSRTCGIYVDNISGSSIFEQVEVIDAACAVYVYYYSTEYGETIPASIAIKNSLFDGRGRFSSTGAILVIPYFTYELDVHLKNLEFRHFNGRAVNLNPTGPITTKATVTLENVTFGSIHRPASINPANADIVRIRGMANVTFIDCEFHDNVGTPIFASDNSSLQFAGNIMFHNNSAYEGGALSFSGGSHLYVSDHARVTFENNTAENVGGAIFVNQNNTYCFVVAQRTSNLCFNCNECLSFNMSFVTNTAKKGGNAIYGAGLDQCRVINQCYGRNLLFQSVFSFDPGFGSDPSVISSAPKQVCLCESAGSNFTCSTDSRIEKRYPGEEFSIFVVDVGDMDGTIDGPVFAQFLPQYGTAKVEDCQSSQQVLHERCTSKVTYTVFSKPGSTSMALTVNTSTILRYDQTKVLYINITLRDCPLGFNLSDTPPHKCVCDSRLPSSITCNITDQTIHRHGTIWVNASFAGNDSGVIVHKDCPFGYCIKKEVNVNLEDPDTQCAFNRSGTLCGACQPGLSLALGSPQCLPCSNIFLSLLIPFAAAGLALVFFIKILDLTVAKGTINGLIFYANIIRASQNTFIPAGDTNPLTVFIAWLNLDLGIKTCFFDGLTGYWNTWLQFVFPLYIWVIVILVLILSSCFQTMSRIFGNNSVPVLATLILLSYSKLLRTIITALSYTFLDLPDGSTIAVWSFDGNIRYLSQEHIPLFLFALGVLLFLWLPFTVLLLFEPVFQKIRNYQVRKWMLRLKPFLDAYSGPFRSNHRYWVGVLLVARGILLLVFGLNSTNDPSVNLLAVNTVVLLLLMYTASVPHRNGQVDINNKQLTFWVGSCYKKWFLSFLENTFLFNLLLLSAATSYTENVGNKRAAVYTSIGIAFCQFIGVVSFHAYKPVNKLWIKIKERNRQAVQREPFSLDYESTQDLSVREKSGNWIQRSWFQPMDQLREPVMEDQQN